MNQTAPLTKEHLNGYNFDALETATVAPTALVARKLNRQYVGFELNPEYIRIAKNRLQSQLGMFV